MKSLASIIHDNNLASRVKASRLVEQYGDALIGRQVDTPEMGEYPGGIAIVMEIEPDVNAPEIVFQVKHPTFGEIGVFENERVMLVDK